VSWNVVIGGGIVGASAAYHLARAGNRTVLVDRRDHGRATTAGAGIIAPGTSLRNIPPFFEMAVPAVRYYPTLIADLEAVDAGDPAYAVPGKLFLAETDVEAAELERVKTLFEERRDAGMPNLGAMQLVSAAEARDLFPAVRDVPLALWIPDAARVDGAHLRDAMTHAAEHHGAEIVQGNSSLIHHGDTVVGVEVDGRKIDVESVVIAAGAWTNMLLEGTGTQLPMAPQKGQIVHIRMPGQDTTRWPILSWFGDQYILAFGPDRVVAGATREFNSGYDTRVTPGGVKHVLDTALRIAPGLGNGTLVEVRVGLRPYADDGVPFVGQVPGYDNLVVATGHGPSGLQLGPYSGRLAAQLACGQEPDIDLGSFRLDRPVQPYPEERVQ
jgi:D-amino-acid dehydrogenase